MIIEGCFFLFLIETIYVVIPYLNRLVETVQMRVHNIYFCAELTEIIWPPYHRILPLIYSSESSSILGRVLYNCHSFPATG